MLPTVFQKGSCKKKIPVFVFLWQPDIWNGLNHNISIGITKLFSSFFPHFVISIQMSILQQLYNCTSNSYMKSVYFFLCMHLRDYILKRLAKYNLKFLIFIEIRVKFSVNKFIFYTVIFLFLKQIIFSCHEICRLPIGSKCNLTTVTAIYL